MNLIILEERDFLVSGRARVTGRRREHLVNILKAGEGDAFAVGALNGLIGRGQIVRIGDDAVEMAVELHEPPPPKHDITVILALPRPPVFRRVISAVTALGVRRLIVIQTARVEKSFWLSPSIEPEAVRHQMVLGLEQAGDTVLPEITLCRTFDEFMSQGIPTLSEGLRLIAHPDAVEVCPADLHGAVTLAIGPEGGFLRNEVEAFEGQGFKAISLGRRILRVETALQALLGRLIPVTG